MPKSSNAEKARYKVLLKLEKDGFIKDLISQPGFLLKGESGIPVATYTPDFKYELVKPLYGYKAKTLIVEEFKGSKGMWAYKRANYKIFVRWLMVDYPQYEFIENISGKIGKPRVRYPKATK